MTSPPEAAAEVCLYCNLLVLRFGCAEHMKDDTHQRRLICWPINLLIVQPPLPTLRATFSHEGRREGLPLPSWERGGERGQPATMRPNHERACIRSPQPALQCRSGLAGDNPRGSKTPQVKAASIRGLLNSIRAPAPPPHPIAGLRCPARRPASPPPANPRPDPGNARLEC